MKGFVRVVFVALAVAALMLSCKKDAPEGSLAFERPAVFLNAGETVTLRIAASDNIVTSSLSVTSQPEGWVKPVVDAANMTIKITAPAEFSDKVKKSGQVIINAVPAGGSNTSASLFVGVVSETKFAAVANSYRVTKPETNYLFEANYKGDRVSTLATAKVGVIWQSVSGLLQYVQLEGDQVSFYVGADNKSKLKEGNALIGAYDSNDVLIWSWHIWVADYDPFADVLVYGDYEVMSRNLGALKNANDTNENILASYGLFYQWGRKEPFIGPVTYNAASGSSATMYNGAGSRVTLTTAASSAETGTELYATQNPLTFITTAKPGDDWFVKSDATSVVPERWSATKKSIYDPCPAGWRVAPAAAFEGLTITNTPTAGDETKYGWELEKNGVKSLYLGAGRRVYLNGSIQNIYPTPTRAEYDQPWMGYYWSADVISPTSSESKALTFWYKKLDNTAGINASTAVGRANGMQIRCVRITL